MSRTPALSESFLTSLRAIGAKLEGGKQIRKEEVEPCLDLLDRLNPHDLAQAEREIVEAASLYRWRRGPSWIEKIFTNWVADADQLHLVQGLEFLFLFHRDGRMREAALQKITGPLPNTFLFATVAWRLNDWAEPVRHAAVECALRCFPATSAGVVAEVAATLLTRQTTWGRWGQEREVLDAAFARRDVLSCLADIVGKSVTGPMASLLRQALRTDGMDGHLNRLSVEAVQPSVRATAMQALITGYAEWPTGWRWRWIDKSMGVRHRETIFERRSLKVRSDAESMIRLGLNDRAAAVRSVAISGLIREQAAIPDAPLLASMMLNDRSSAVRERAEFLLKRADEAKH